MEQIKIAFAEHERKQAERQRLRDELQRRLRAEQEESEQRKAREEGRLLRLRAAERRMDHARGDDDNNNNTNNNNNDSNNNNTGIYNAESGEMKQHAAASAAAEGETVNAEDAMRAAILR